MGPSLKEGQEALIAGGYAEHWLHAHPLWWPFCVCLVCRARTDRRPRWFLVEQVSPVPALHLLAAVRVAIRGRHRRWEPQIWVRETPPFPSPSPGPWRERACLWQCVT